MHFCLNRRNHPRVSLAGINETLRQCGLTLDSRPRYCEGHIEDISPEGLCLRLCRAGDEDLRPGERILFSSCVFNGLTGFLSSVTGEVRWSAGDLRGVRFDEPLDIDCRTLARLAGQEPLPARTAG